MQADSTALHIQDQIAAVLQRCTLATSTDTHFFVQLTKQNAAEPLTQHKQLVT